MRLLVLAAVTLTALAGCVETGGDGEDFQITCPSWWPAPDNFRGNSGFIHNATSSNEDWREKEHHEKRVVHPGTPGGYTYSYTDPEGTASSLNGGVLDHYVLDLATGAQRNGSFLEFGPVDARVIIEAHRAPRDEDPRGPEDGELGPPTGEVLRFENQTGTESTHQIVIEEGQILNGTYWIRLTDGRGPVDPASLRLDFYYFGDQDGDTQTDSYAEIWMETTRWYRHRDCV